MSKVINGLTLEKNKKYRLVLRSGSTIDGIILNFFGKYIILETEDSVEEVMSDNIYFYSKVC